MSSRRALHAAALLSAVIASVGVAAIGAADPNVCTLPASALYFTRTASTTPAPAGTAARNATAAPSSRALCSSQSAGVTVEASCLSACTCRRLESEVTASRTSRFVGVCLNSSAAFQCSGSGVSNCSSYALNGDGSSTLKSAAANSTTSPAPTSSPAAATPGPSSDDSATSPVAGATNRDIKTTEEEKTGLAAWVWAVIVVGIVFVLAIAVFAINWLKHRPRYTKQASEHTESVDDPWHGGGALQQHGQTPSAAMAARTSQVPEPTPVSTSVPTAGVPEADYYTYRLGSTPGQVHRVYDSTYDVDIDAMSMTRTSDGDSSIELHSPHMPPIYSAASSYGRRSSMPPPAGRRDRAANDSQLSYATSDGSYRSGVNSFSSQITLTDLESRESESMPLDGSYVRKRSTEF